MKGSMLSQPPTFTPRIGFLPYPKSSFKLGTFSFAWTSSSHDELRPMTGRPPTISFVYVTLKSVVSHHDHGSNMPPRSASGTLSLFLPSRLPLEGCEEPPAAWPPPPPPPPSSLSLFFFDARTATGIMMARRMSTETTPITAKS